MNSRAVIIGQFYHRISCFSIVWNSRVVSGVDSNYCDFGNVAEVKVNKSRHTEVRELDESVMWLLPCPQMIEKTMSHLSVSMLYEAGENELAS